MCSFYISPLSLSSPSPPHFGAQELERRGNSIFDTHRAMLLGKRPRPSMKRTTSLSQLPARDNSPPDHHASAHPLFASEELGQSTGKRPQQQKQRQILPTSTSSPRNPRMHLGDFTLEAAHFLGECGLCKSRLGPGRDTFMYRGEIAFCSLECRQQRMALDERKEKCLVASASKNPFHVASAAKPPVTTEAAAI